MITYICTGKKFQRIQEVTLFEVQILTHAIVCPTNFESTQSASLTSILQYCNTENLNWTQMKTLSPLSSMEHELIISARDVNEPPSPPNISIWVYFPFTTPEFLINETINFLCSDDWIDWNHQGSLRQDPSGSQLLKKLFRSRRGTDQGRIHGIRAIFYKSWKFYMTNNICLLYVQNL